MRLKWHAVVFGKENIPKHPHKGGFIIAANHQSYTDPPLIAAFVNGKFSFIAKAELFKKKMFALLIRYCGAYPVERGAGDTGALDRAVSDLKKGRIFVIFPEGTRSKDGSIAKAKSGIALIAGMANVPVLPCCIVYKDNRAYVSFGKIIPAEAIAVKATERTEIRRVCALITDSLRQLQSEMLVETKIVLPYMIESKDETEV
jgi:1-acyl-sn-glycerol-3-phosphate acyltransferase